MKCFLKNKLVGYESPKIDIVAVGEDIVRTSDSEVLMPEPDWN